MLGLALAGAERGAGIDGGPVTQTLATRPISLRASLRVQARVVRALLIREILSRHGVANLGFFWVVGEPMLLTCGIMVLWTLIRQTHGADVGVIPFALSGYSLIQLWRFNAFGGVRAMSHSAWMTYHANVGYFDVLLAKSLVPCIGVFGSFVLAYVPLYLLGAMEPPRDPLLMVGAWALMAWFGFAFSLVLAGASELSELVEKFIHPVMYLTLPLTGTFFMVSWLPAKAQYVVSWSPLVNGVEMFRCGLFAEGVRTTWDAWYLVAWCVGLTAIGLPGMAAARRSIHVQ